MKSKAPYRNAIRSRKMIKQGFLQLICEKDISKIKVLEITDIADISKGTFYTHYHDVYAVLEAIENDCINGMTDVLKKIVSVRMFEDLTPFLSYFFAAINKESERYSHLLRSTCAVAFLSKMQQRFVEFMMNEEEMVEKIKTVEQARILFSFIAVGISNIIYEYFNGETSMTLPDIATYLSGCIIHGVSTVMK